MTQSDYWVRLHRKIDVADVCNELAQTYTFQPGATISRGLTLSLTAAQAETLRQHPCVREVAPVEVDWEDVLYGTHSGQFFKWDQESINTQATFSGTPANWYTDQRGTLATNWALLDCTDLTSQDYGVFTSVSNKADEQLTNYWKAGDYTLYSEGQHVDVIITDTCIPRDHPEFGARFQAFDWNTLTSYVLNELGYGSDLLDAEYTYCTNAQWNATENGNTFHGGHVATTAAGTTNGWAKQANVYNMSIPLGGVTVPEGSSIFQTAEVMMQYIRAFHLSKAINPATGRKNPTVVNASWGSGWTIPIFNAITDVVWDGDTYNDQNPFPFNNKFDRYGFSYDTSLRSAARASFYSPLRAGTLDDVLEDGVIWVAAAGNDAHYLDKPGGSREMDNVNGITTCRTTWGESIVVGNLYCDEQRTNNASSNFGPGITVWAPGSRIVASWGMDPFNSWGDRGPAGEEAAIDDKYGQDYYIASIDGTSMASPQVAGIIACAASASSDYRFTQNEAIQYLDETSQAGGITQYSSFLTYDDQFGTTPTETPNRWTAGVRCQQAVWRFTGNANATQFELLSQGSSLSQDANGLVQGFVDEIDISLFTSAAVRGEGYNSPGDQESDSWGWDLVAEDQDGNLLPPYCRGLNSPAFIPDLGWISEWAVTWGGHTNLQDAGITKIVIKDNNTPGRQLVINLTAVDKNNLNYGSTHFHRIPDSDMRTVVCKSTRPTSGLVMHQQGTRNHAQRYPRPTTVFYAS